ncbi:MAG TPA: alkaline phosphatase family protein [Candidatus Brocadiia bacterium]|nr:alkaline phosphatase family protein [Candidatus Brocadiales bacterium]
MNNNKVVIIGLDGASFSLIMPWIKEGKLPVLAKLIREGSWGNLRSTIPINSAAAWSSFITGKNPGKHGIFDFRYHEGNSHDIRFINSRRRRGKSLWKILSEHNKKVCVFNVPITYPPEEVNGSMISGLTAPEVNEKIFYPQELFKEIVSKVGMFTIKPFARDHIRLNRFDRIFEEMASVVDQHFNVANYLLQSKAWDFFCMVFGTTDHVQHFFWQHMDPNHPFHRPLQNALYGECIFKIYKKIDECVGSLIERLDDDTTVIILSDHGAGANGNRALYLNNWLSQEGFLTYKDNPETNNGRFGFLKNIVLFAKKHIPRKYKNKFRGITWLKSRVETIYWDSCIDWTQTRAFSDDSEGLIWINLKGRESEGTVQNGKEYEDIRTKIIDRALDFTDPESGEKIFSEALRREEIYHGDMINLAPDIILVQMERQYTYPYRNSSLSRNKLPIETVTTEETRNNPVQTASHRRDGIMIIKGFPVQCGKNVTDARIIDIAPMALYLMGAPIPEDMDGCVIKDAINESYLNINPIIYSEADKSIIPVSQQAEYTSNEEKQVEETLKSLGYMD